MFISLNIKEDYDTSDVIDDALLSLPSFEGSSYKTLSGTLCVLLYKEWIDDVGHLLICHELPNTIRGQNDNLIFRSESEFFYLGYRIDTDSACHRVAKRTAHCQAWDVLSLEPDSHRSDLVAKLVSIALNSTIIGLDMHFLVGIVRLVVTT